MVYRLFNPLKSRSFFIFGPRGVGKSTWLRAFFDPQSTITFNLLDPALFEAFQLDPNKFREVITSKENQNKLVIIDEVQKVPALLDIIHDLISQSKRLFVLTGSSARRLKQKGVNLLAGRASIYHMYPFSMLALGESFALSKGLERGLLRESYLATSDAESG